jgi:hypothetical protein
METIEAGCGALGRAGGQIARRVGSGFVGETVCREAVGDAPLALHYN